MGIFGLIFIILPIIILLVVLSIGLTLVRNVLRIFGREGSSRWGQYAGSRTSSESGHSARSGGARTQSASAPPKVKKVIGDDEGEYVEFEEVK